MALLAWRGVIDTESVSGLSFNSILCGCHVRSRQPKRSVPVVGMRYSDGCFLGICEEPVYPATGVTTVSEFLNRNAADSLRKKTRTR